MQHDDVEYLRSTSHAWKLLRADTAPLVLGALGQVFVVDNVRSIAETDLLARVDDILFAANRSAGQPTTRGRAPGPDDPHGGARLAYPRTARDYVDTWAAPENGWLRKFYPDGSSEAHYDATVDVERAYAFLTGLRTRSFVGTESRLQTVVDLLREIVAAADEDPAARVAELRRRRDELDAEIARAESGTLAPMDGAALRDRYQHLASTARELLSDFRAVEENFRSLDRDVRADIAAWDGSKGELLDQIVGDRHAIADSDQGRSFQAFHDFLLSPSRREELTDLLDALVGLAAIETDPAIRHIHYDWIDAAERTQQTVRQLSEQLRRFLDDKVWLESRRVVELLRSIERSALAIRTSTGPGPGMELDALAPAIRLPFERPLYAPPTFTGVDSSVSAAGDEPGDPAALAALFDQVHVDTARLTDTVRRSLRGRDQVSLVALLDEYPLTQGVSELVSYLGLAEEDFAVVIDEGTPCTILLEDSSGALRTVRMPQVHLVRQPVASREMAR